MLKYLFILVLIVLGSNLIAQNDSTLIINSETTESYKLFELPFNEKFVSQLEYRNNIIEKSKTSNFKNYLFLFLLNLLTISVLLLNFSRIKVKKILATMFNINMLNQYAQVEIKRDNKYIAAYFTLVIIFISLAVFVLSNLFNNELDIFNIGLTISLFFIVDAVIDRVTSYLTNYKEPYATVLFNNVTFVIILLPVLIIGIICLVFLPENFSKGFAYFFALLISVIFLWKEFRNIFILASNKIKIFSFYFFLYLCTFKILPFIILFKLILDEIIK